jgi:Flp pilus assembly pilin Flp
MREGSQSLVTPNFGLTSGFWPVMMMLGETESGGEKIMTQLVRWLWSEDQGQDIAEYAVMLAVILVLVVGTIRLIGGNANNAFSATASAISQ